MAHASGKEVGGGTWRALVVLCISLAATVGLLVLRETAAPLRLLIEGSRDTLQWQILSRRSLPAPAPAVAAAAEGAAGEAAAGEVAQPPAVLRPKPQPQQLGQQQKAEPQLHQAREHTQPPHQQVQERTPRQPAALPTCSLDIQASPFGRACTVLENVCVDQV